MQRIQLQLDDQLYVQLQRRAHDAGFTKLDEYIVGLVSEDITCEQERLDHSFSPAVIAHLDKLREGIQSGAPTYSESNVETYLTAKAQAWRASHPS